MLLCVVRVAFLGTSPIEEIFVKSLAQVSLVVLLSMAASGCVYINGERVTSDDWREDQRVNREMISQLDLGVTRSAVVEKLGTPTDSEAFTRDGEEVRVLFYRTQRKHSDGQTTRDEMTPVVFKNDLLVGWGDGAYQDFRS